MFVSALLGSSESYTLSFTKLKMTWQDLKAQSLFLSQNTLYICFIKSNNQKGAFWTQKIIKRNKLPWFL